MERIYIPEGINFDCTGCGNCCLAWPVPLTASDYDRILKHKDDLWRQSQGSKLFGVLKSSDWKLKGFTHTLEKRADGKCEFLTVDNRCQLHLQYGDDMKPAMCLLFPYTFNRTPTGVFVSLSFASTGVLLNLGESLTKQVDLLKQKWELFGRLFPSLNPDWSNTQLIDGHLLSWDEYMEIDNELLRLFSPSTGGQIEKRMLAMSRYLSGKLANNLALERKLPLSARPKTIDQILLKHLFGFYLPDDVFAENAIDLDFQVLLKQFVAPPQVVPIYLHNEEFSFQQIKEYALGKLDPESEDLLFRFVYCRLFAKLYFGAGFSNLSVLAGLHHLGILIALVRIKIKMMSLLRDGAKPGFAEIVEIVRALERRLTQISLSRESITILEVLLTSTERLERILYLAA